MDLQLNGKTALVSGSSKGIGFAIANQLAAEGAHVIVNSRSAAAVSEALNAIRYTPGAKPEGFVGDLSRAEDAAKLVKQFPSVDILVNNLGIFEPKSFDEIPDDDWLRFFE